MLIDLFACFILFLWVYLCMHHVSLILAYKTIALHSFVMFNLSCCSKIRTVLCAPVCLLMCGVLNKYMSEVRWVRWVVERSITSCSSSDMATRCSGLLSLSKLLSSVCISLSSSCRRRSTRDDTCRQSDGERLRSCKHPRYRNGRIW